MTAANADNSILGSIGPERASPGRGVLSREGFAALFETSYRALWCIAAAVTSNRSKAADVVQDAAVIALGKLHEFDPGTSFPAWMGQIVRFVALNEGRRSARERTHSDDSAFDSASRGGSGSADPIPGGEGGFDARVQRALDLLDEVPRTCLLLRTTQDLSYKEIAAAMSIPEGTAMSHVFRARKMMRESLEQEEQAATDPAMNRRANRS